MAEADGAFVKMNAMDECHTQAAHLMVETQSSCLLPSSIVWYGMQQQGIVESIGSSVS
jgi:hypothetical protein